MGRIDEEIDRWIREGEEGHHLEFKEAKTQIDFKKLCKYCIALMLGPRT